VRALEAHQSPGSHNDSPNTSKLVGESVFLDVRYHWVAQCHHHVPVSALLLSRRTRGSRLRTGRENAPTVPGGL
jgi:hypothetical protein